LRRLFKNLILSRKEQNELTIPPRENFIVGWITIKREYS